MNICITCKIEKPLYEFVAKGQKARSPTCSTCLHNEIKMIRDRHERRRRLHLLAGKKYKLRYPEKHCAHNAVHRALKAGKLKRQSCEVCGCSDVEGHHDDYSKPLEVRWLCKKHHAEVHRKGQRDE